MKGKKAGLDYAWLAERFASMQTTMPDGQRGFEMHLGKLGFDELLSYAITHITFDNSVSDIQRRMLIAEALRSAGQAGEITEQSLEKAIARQKTEYEKKPKQEWVLATSLSMNRPNDLRRLSFDGAIFTFSDELPQNFSRRGIELHSPWNPPDDLPATFTKVRVRVRARSEFDAVNSALSSLDYLRGIWNFLFNRTFAWRWDVGPVTPINSIFPGPVHTLHHSSGALAANGYWHEQNYTSHLKAQRLSDWDRLKLQTADIRKKIARHPYQAFIRETFTRYARSLDGMDHDSSFLKAWSLLEHLTDMGRDGNYAKVLSRTLFLYEDSNDYHERILEHLRERRNRSVHRGEIQSNASELVFQLKGYIEFLILSHLRVGNRVKTPAEFGQMLDSPRDVNQIDTNVEGLRRRIEILQEARKLHNMKNRS